MKKLFMFFIAVALIAAFSVPAAAEDAEWSFYGSARMSTFSIDTSKEMNAGGHTPPASDRDTAWDLQGNSRIGARVSAGDVGGRFEYGTGVNVRLLYGTWNFGAGTLLVGQTYTPVNIFISNQVYGDIGADSDMLSTGGLYDGRRPVIQLAFGGFKVALVQPSTSVPVTGIAGEEVDTVLPKIELAYTFKTDMFRVGVLGGYNSVDIDTDAKDYSVDSYVAALWGQVNLGPAYIKANIYQALNGGDFGIQGAGDDNSDFVGAKIQDVDTLGVLFVAGVKLGDAINIEGGYGVVSHASDIPGTKDDDTSAMYVQATIGFAPGVFIVPEIGVIDYDKNRAGVKEGDILYFGAKWQINF